MVYLKIKFLGLFWSAGIVTRLDMLMNFFRVAADYSGALTGYLIPRSLYLCPKYRFTELNSNRNCSNIMTTISTVTSKATAFPNYSFSR